MTSSKGNGVSPSGSPHQSPSKSAGVATPLAGPVAGDAENPVPVQVDVSRKSPIAFPQWSASFPVRECGRMNSHYYGTHGKTRDAGRKRHKEQGTRNKEYAMYKAS